MADDVSFDDDVEREEGFSEEKAHWFAFDEAVEEVPVGSELPILPLRGVVVFPAAIVPLLISLPSSLALVERALVGDRVIGLVAQRAPEQESPGPDDLYGRGCAGRILKMLKYPDGNIRILVQGLRRILAMVAGGLAWAGAPSSGVVVAAGVVNALFLLSVGLVYRLEGQLTWQGFSALTTLTGGLALGAIVLGSSAGADGAMRWLLLPAIDALVFSQRWRDISNIPYSADMFASAWHHRRTQLLAARFFLLDAVPFFVLAVSPSPVAIVLAPIGLALDRIGFYALALQQTTGHEVASVESRLEAMGERTGMTATRARAATSPVFGIWQESDYELSLKEKAPVDQAGGFQGVYPFLEGARKDRGHDRQKKQDNIPPDFRLRRRRVGGKLLPPLLLCGAPCSFFPSKNSSDIH